MGESNGIVLFVDDNPMQIRLHVRRLKEKTNGKYDFIQCETLLHAINFTLENNKKIRLFVIDLYLPNAYHLLNEYVEQIPGGVTYNQGQLFARFVEDNFNISSFIFLTNLPEAYTGNSIGTVFDKDPEQMEEFLRKALDFL